MAHLVRFEQGDAERLTLDDGQFDAVICECAFCTFPDKRAAAAEFARVLKPGGTVGLTDLTRSGAELGYKPMTSFDEGVRRQWEWLRSRAGQTTS